MEKMESELTINLEWKQKYNILEQENTRLEVLVRNHDDEIESLQKWKIKYDEVTLENTKFVSQLRKIQEQLLISMQTQRSLAEENKNL